jgi:hypothetical protein
VSHGLVAIGRKQTYFVHGRAHARIAAVDREGGLWWVEGIEIGQEVTAWEIMACRRAVAALPAPAPTHMSAGLHRFVSQFGEGPLHAHETGLG